MMSGGKRWRLKEMVRIPICYTEEVIDVRAFNVTMPIQDIIGKSRHELKLHLGEFSCEYLGDFACEKIGDGWGHLSTTMMSVDPRNEKIIARQTI